MSLNKHPWTLNSIDQQLIALALEEDLGKAYRDVTSELVFSDRAVKYQLEIISKADKPVVLCGLVLIEPLVKQLGATCEWESAFQDGDTVLPRQTIVTFKGDAVTLLMLERTLLNFMQRLSAVATLTQRFVEKIKHSQLKILDTRKTTPGFRHLEKYAVQMGGGVNHRMGLYDAIMVKDNHSDLYGGLEKLLKKMPENNDYFVIVEVRSRVELEVVLKFGKNKVNRVLLDNMTPAQLQECVAVNQKMFETEASGGITLDNIAEIANTGVDYASIGALTHSAGSVDLSMRVSQCL